MSLHALANNMAAQGRGPDSTLVHMSPQEVDGLQALAMRHGGSLTINPQTGLPEAGFLSSILPLIAGIGLTAMGMPAGMAALTVGGGTALATGDLKKGLMAGLGAYGGAGLAESLIGSGAAGLVPEAAAASLNAVPTETAAQIASANQAGLTMPSAVEPAISASLPPVNAADPFRLGSSVAPQPFDKLSAPTPNYTSPITTTPSPYSNVSNATAGGPMAKYGGPSILDTTYPVQPTLENMTMGQRFDALQAGTTGQNLLDYAKNNKLATAGMLAGPLMASEDNNAPFTPVGDADRGAMANAGYQFDPGWSNPIPAADPYGREQRYNRPRFYIPKKAANGGAVQHFDVGGTVNRFNQTPALNKFAELQAARAAIPAPATINAKQQFTDYLGAQSRPVSTATPYHPVVESHLPVTDPTLDTRTDNFINDNVGINRIGNGNLGNFVDRSGNLGGEFSGSGAAAGSSISPDAGADNNINPGWGSRDAGGGTPSAANPMELDPAQRAQASLVDMTSNPMELDPAQRAQASLVDMTSNSLTNNPAVGGGGETGYTNSLTENPAVGEGGETVQSGYTNSLTNNPAVGEGGETGYTNSLTENPAVGEGGETNFYTGGNFGGGFGSGGGCPAPWINITLADGGTIKAGDIKPGMMVYTRHETTNEWGNFPVTVVRKGEDTRWAILFESGIEFVGTFNHPVMVNDAWVEIQHLKAGDKVVQPEGFAVVKSAKYFDHGPIVKIEVQDAHTYLTEGFLSHNKNMADYDFGNMRAEEFEFDDFYANGGGIAALAGGGMYNLGSYSDGGRLLRGPGDGVSDSIPAVIGRKQPARLADGEFVIPARIVSEIGNGSTEAGARKLYAMMDKVQSARRATVGKGKVAKNTRADRYLPA